MLFWLRNRLLGPVGGRSDRLILVLVVLALAVRVWGVWFGFPYIYHDDEPNEVVRALRLGMGSFDFGRNAKGGYFYLLFSEYAVFFLALLALGVIGSPTEFAYLYMRDPWPFYLIGRVTTALLGALTVFLVYRLGCRAYGRRVGLLGALFLAGNYLHALYSHYATVDVPMTFLVTLGLIYALRIYESGAVRDYILAGVFTALATMTKLPGALVCLPIFVAHWYAGRRKQETIRDVVVGKKIVLYVVTSAVVFAIGNPGFFLHFGRQMSGIVSLFTETSSPGPTNFSFAGELREPPNRFLYYGESLLDSMGWPLFVVSMCGLLYAFLKRKREDVVLLVFLVPFYLLLATSAHRFLYYARYVIPLLPGLCLMAGRVLEAASVKVGLDKKKGLVAAVAVLLIVVPTVRIVVADYQMCQKDTRTFAKEWIEATIPEGSTVFIEGSRTRVLEGTVFLQNSRENIEKRIAEYRTTYPAKARYFELELKARSGPTYDLETVGPYKPLQDFAYYQKRGVQYLVLRPEIYKWHKSRKVLDDFLNELKEGNHVRLLQRFEEHWLYRPGPTIEIYEMVSTGRGPGNATDG